MYNVISYIARYVHRTSKSWLPSFLDLPDALDRLVRSAAGSAPQDSSGRARQAPHQEFEPDLAGACPTHGLLVLRTSLIIFTALIVANRDDPRFPTQPRVQWLRITSTGWITCPPALDTTTDVDNVVFRSPSGTPLQHNRVAVLTKTSTSKGHTTDINFDGATQDEHPTLANALVLSDRKVTVRGPVPSHCFWLDADMICYAITLGTLAHQLDFTDVIRATARSFGAFKLTTGTIGSSSGGAAMRLFSGYSPFFKTVLSSSKKNNNRTKRQKVQHDEAEAEEAALPAVDESLDIGGIRDLEARLAASEAELETARSSLLRMSIRTDAALFKTPRKRQRLDHYSSPRQGIL
ncbi:hypothetical protein SDRG_12480, partial [Saprolegnia diclina VS20]